MDQAEYERMHAVEDRMWWYRGLRLLVTELLGRALERSTASGYVLDAGCGTGGMLAKLGSGVGGHPTIGLEYDPTAAEFASAKTRRPIVVGSVTKMPLDDAGIAAYLSLDVLCHAGVEPEVALDEARRCLTPDGVAIFNLPAYSWLLSAHDKRVHNVRRFTRGMAHRLLAEHGFRVLISTYWNTLLFPLMLLHRLIEKDDAESDVRDFPHWQDVLFSTALTIERMAIRCGVRLPFGGSLILVAVRDG